MKVESKLQPASAALSRRAWLFGAPAVLGIIAFALLLAFRQGALTSKDRINFLSNSALGITVGMPVKLNGFVVGTVEQIALLPPSVESALRVRVGLSIYHNYMSYIPKTTVARLLQEGLIGQSVIELLPQRYDARAVANGEVLAFERSMGLGEIAEQMRDQLAPVLHNTQALTASLNDPNGHFQQSLQTAHTVLSALPATNAQVQQSVAQASASLGRVERHVERTLDNAGQTLTTLNGTLPAMLGKLDETAGNLQQASSHLRQISAGTLEAAPALIDDARAIGADGRRIVTGAAESWPLNTLLAAPAPRAIALDSQQGLPTPGAAAP